MSERKGGREKVRCGGCGRIIAGKIPKGGDGSVLIPYHHQRYNTTAQVEEECPGIFAFGLAVKNEEPPMSTRKAKGER